MTTTQLLTVTQAAGIVLEVQGDRLVVDAPSGTLTPELRDQLVQHKPALLAALAPPRGFVTLRNGPTVPVEALELALDLEARGVPLRTTADHQFIVPEDARLTEADQTAIARWRHHLGAIVDYRAPQVS